MDEKLKLTCSYNLNSDELPCEYITRLQYNLNKNNCSIYTIMKMLDSTINDMLKELNQIKNNINSTVNNIKYLKTIKEIFNLSKTLNNDLILFQKYLEMRNQINSIKIDGDNPDMVIELQDSINENRILINQKLNEIADLYRKLIDEANNSYSELDDEYKEKFDAIINQFSINNSDDNVLEVQHEDTILNYILGISNAVGSGIWYLLKKFWVLIVSIIGIEYFSDGIIYKLFKNLSHVKTVTIYSLLVVFGLCLAIYLYHRIYDAFHKKQNNEIAEKISTTSNNSNNNQFSTISNDNVSISTNAPEEVINNSFRGFNNSASYTPDDNLENNDNKYSIF